LHTEKVNFLLLYIDSSNIKDNLHTIIKERTDERGNEIWYQLMMNYLKDSPYGKQYHYNDFSDLVAHLERRRKLELEVIKRIPKEQVLIIPSKNYIFDDILTFINTEY